MEILQEKVTIMKTKKLQEGINRCFELAAEKLVKPENDIIPSEEQKKKE